MKQFKLRKKRIKERTKAKSKLHETRSKGVEQVNENVIYVQHLEQNRKITVRTREMRCSLFSHLLLFLEFFSSFLLYGRLVGED